MGDNVVPFRARQANQTGQDNTRPEPKSLMSDDPHWRGNCLCLNCRHSWEGSAPIGTRWVECPKCGCGTGHIYTPIEASPGDLEYHCNCGGLAFTAIRREGYFFILCMVCGADQTEPLFG